MGYIENVYNGIYHVEHEYYFKGGFGAKGEKKAEKKKPTPEQIRQWYNAKRSKLTRRTIQLNFVPGDYLVTLKYPKGMRPDMETVKGHRKKFFDLMRREYRKQGKAMKYITRLEIGPKGGVHAHNIMNRLEGGLEIMTRIWRKARGVTAIEDMVAADSTELPELVSLDGKVDVRLLYLDGGYRELADYLCKPLPGEIEGNLSRDDKKNLYSLSCSRNLKRPEPERKRFSHWTMRKLIEAGPEKINTDPALRKRYLKPGHLIDKETWESGINPFTGLSYLYFTEVRAT